MSTKINDEIREARRDAFLEKVEEKFPLGTGRYKQWCEFVDEIDILDVEELTIAYSKLKDEPWPGEPITMEDALEKYERN